MCSLQRDPSNLHRPDGGIGLAGPGSNEEMLSLKKQMEELGLHVSFRAR